MVFRRERASERALPPFTLTPRRRLVAGTPVTEGAGAGEGVLSARRREGFASCVRERESLFVLTGACCAMGKAYMSAGYRAGGHAEGRLVMVP